MGKTVTSLKVDDDIWKKMKIKCIELDIELADAVTDALKGWLKTK